MWKTLTALVVVGVPVCLIAYDWLAGHFGGPEATITRAIQSVTVAFPELPALAAAVFVWLWMHLFMNHIVARVNQHLPPHEASTQKGGE